MLYFNIGLILLIVGLIVFNTNKYIKHKTVAGETIVDLYKEQSKGAKAIKIVGLFVLLFVVYYIYLGRVENDDYLVYQFIFWSLWWVYLSMVILLDAKFTQNGILKYTYFIRWDDVKSYEWKDLSGREKYSLRIKYKGINDKYERNIQITVKGAKNKEKIHSLMKEEI